MRVVIVDDASFVRERLKALLRADAPHAEVVGEVGRPCAHAFDAFKANQVSSRSRTKTESSTITTFTAVLLNLVTGSIPCLTSKISPAALFWHARRSDCEAG